MDLQRNLNQYYIKKDREADLSRNIWWEIVNILNTLITYKDYSCS